MENDLSIVHELTHCFLNTTITTCTTTSKHLITHFQLPQTIAARKVFHMKEKNYTWYHPNFNIFTAVSVRIIFNYAPASTVHTVSFKKSPKWLSTPKHICRGYTLSKSRLVSTFARSFWTMPFHRIVFTPVNNLVKHPCSCICFCSRCPWTPPWIILSQ